MTNKALANQLLELGRNRHLDAIGIAPARPFERAHQTLLARQKAGLSAGMKFTYTDPRRATDPSASLPGARSLVVVAKSYHRQDPLADAPRPANQGRVARYSWADHYQPLRAALDDMASLVVAAGWQAVVRVDDNSLVDKEAAVQAGLGWYGKNTLVLIPRHGSWFVLGSVITNAPLPTTTTTLVDGCGSCSRCISACPTGAIIEPGVLDARRCLAWLLEAPGPFPLQWRKALGGRIYGCDDCQEACPPNRAGPRRTTPPAAQSGDQAWVDLTEVLASSDAQIISGLGRWYIPRRQARYVRRNALVALGNVGNPGDPRVTGALTQALENSDALVRAHAVWACAQLGRFDLAAGMELHEADPEVLEELARARTGIGSSS
ncbi:MAG: tRNA epoxyqueuosine(34) reductase QueG [Acidimicrobiales bacterium]